MASAKNDAATVQAAKTAARAAAQTRRAQAWRTWQQQGSDGAGAALAGHAAALLRQAAEGTRPERVAQVVSAYLPMRTEIDPLPLLAALAAAGCATCLPVVPGRKVPLLFRRWASGEPTVPAGFGTREPAQAAAMVTPTLLLVPLLAFDARGGRLGYGGGYYDRTLSRLRAGHPGAAFAVGVAFDEQEVDAVPHLDYDERLDAILTPAGVRRAMG